MLLSVRNLTTQLALKKKQFTVVNKVSFDLEPGKTIAIVGESGSGKSMTALSIMRILPPKSIILPESKIFFKNQDLLTLPEKAMQALRGKKISMIFQDPIASLHPLYTVGFQIKEAIFSHNEHSEEEMQRLIDQVLDDVRLPDKKILDLYPHELSGGMAQRVMIAMALVLEPDLLIADEPTTALDVTIQKQIVDLLKLLQKKRKMGMILITHDMHVVAELADEVFVMYAAEKIEEAKAEDLFDFPSHPYTQKLFQAQISHHLSLGNLPTIKGRVPELSEKLIGCAFQPRCSYAQPICKQPPPYFALPNENHWAKCWMLDPLQETQFDNDSTFTS